ncbi:MAG: hypothetical protein EHM19_11360, partial [Candidatus Latescibacterota bacterium]
MKRGLGSLAALLLVSSVHANVIDVPSETTLLQAAINAAVAGDTVRVAAGTYDSLFYPPGSDTTRCVAYMKSGITLLGAGIGQTIIDGMGQGRGIFCLNVASGRIEGFTIRNSFAENHGAGIYCYQNSSPTIRSCEVTECGDGGIICRFGSSPSIEYSEITDNVYKLGGGMLIEAASSPQIVHTLIRGNSAPAVGGVLIKDGSAPSFEDCTIDSNYVTDFNASAGGVSITTASATFNRCSITRNRANGSGGGLDIRDESTVVIDSCVIADNATTDDFGPGGGIYCELSDLSLTNSEIARNSAPGTDGLSDGGGLFLFVADETYVAQITGCTFAENASKTGGLGGGIYLQFANPTIQRTIIAANENGAGLYCDAGSTPSVGCTDIWGNDGADAVCGNDLGGNFSADPLFCAFPSGDYTLQAASPCLPGQHPNGASCGLIGAYGLGPCN